jgi:hypothetical protein
MDRDVPVVELQDVVAGLRVSAHAERGTRAGARQVHLLEPPHVRHVLVAREHDVRTGVDEHLEHVAGVHHRAPLTAGPGDRDQVVVEHEDLQLRGLRELLADPAVVASTDHPLVQIGLARVGADDPHAGDVDRPVPRPDQLLEVQVPDVAGVVVAGNGVERGVDPVREREPRLVLLPVPLGREVAAADDGVRPQLVQLLDHLVQHVGHEVRRADVRIGDVGDRDHGGSVGTARHRRRGTAWDDGPP